MKTWVCLACFSFVHNDPLQMAIYELLCTEKLSIMLIFFYIPNVKENKKYQIHDNTQVFLHNLVENWIHFLLMFKVFCTLFSNLKTKSTCTFLHVTFVWCYIKSFNNTLLKGKACYVCVAKKPICIEHKKSMIWFLFLLYNCYMVKIHFYNVAEEIKTFSERMDIRYLVAR